MCWMGVPSHCKIGDRSKYLLSSSFFQFSSHGTWNSGNKTFCFTYLVLWANITNVHSGTNIFDQVLWVLYIPGIWCTRYERALWDGLSCCLRDLNLLSSMFSIQAFFSAALVQMKIFESTIGPRVYHKYRCTMFKYFCDFKILIFRVNLEI